MFIMLKKTREQNFKKIEKLKREKNKVKLELVRQILNSIRKKRSQEKKTWKISENKGIGINKEEIEL